MTASLVFSRVGRWFHTPGGTLEALRDVSCEVAAGSFTAIVGPSGCGKTTLLHIAAGLDTLHSGSFRRTPPDATAAYMFQSPRLLPWLSARRNVVFVLQHTGWTRSAALRRVGEMLSLVGLEGVGDRYPGQLSGGMQQRVALARALAVDPDMLLMDEPFSSLDELTAQRLRSELLELFGAKQRTIVLVTHNIHEACYLADRVLVMSPRPGRLVADVEISVRRPRAYDDPRLAVLASRIFDDIERAQQEANDGSGRVEAASRHLPLPGIAT